MKPIRFALSAFLPLLFLALAAPADTTPKAKPDPNKGGDPKVLIEDAATRQAQLKRAFETFRTRLSLYANRLENGSPEDKQKAQSIKKAIKLISELGTAGRFDAVISGLTKKNADQNLDVLGRVVKDNKELRQDLQMILALLLDGDAKKLAERKARAKELLEKLKEARDKQERVQVQTEMGKQDNKALAKAQDKVTDQTKEALNPPENAGEQDGKELETVKKPVEEAIKEQQNAGKQLKSGQPKANGMASESQGKAVAKLDEAIKKLEELLKQLREEERQQKLADLLARCKRMLALQMEVRDGTVKVDADITKTTKDGKPTLVHAARVTKLSDQELTLVREASAALKLVKAEETAVVFAEVFEQVHKDMDVIHSRLERTDVGKVTQQIEDDVIATLEDIIKALEQAMREPQDADAKRGGGKPGEQKLVKFLQQLKLIMATQRRINQRTELYAKTYTGEQAPLPEAAKDAKEREHLTAIEKELKDLANRQDRLSKVTRDVSKQPEARQ